MNKAFDLTLVIKYQVVHSWFKCDILSAFLSYEAFIPTHLPVLITM